MFVKLIHFTANHTQYDQYQGKCYKPLFHSLPPMYYTYLQFCLLKLSRQPNVLEISDIIGIYAMYLCF